MWKLHIWMACHPFATELKLCSLLESGGDYGRRRYATFLKRHGVVHTAQRTRTSTTQPCNCDIHLLHHIADHLFGGGFGVMLLSTHDYAFDSIALT
mgnify:CR=1 FL=1